MKICSKLKKNTYLKFSIWIKINIRKQVEIRKILSDHVTQYCNVDGWCQKGAIPLHCIIQFLSKYLSLF